MASSAVVVHNTGHEHNYCPSQSQTCLERGPIQYIGYCTCTYTYTKVGFLFLCKLVRCKCLFKNSRLCPPLLILPPLHPPPSPPPHLPSYPHHHHHHHHHQHPYLMQYRPFVYFLSLFSWHYNPLWLYFHSPVAGFSFPVFEVSWSHTTNDTPQSVGLPWTSDQSVAGTSTWQHTTLTTDKYPCPRWDSNPQSQQASGRRPKP